MFQSMLFLNILSIFTVVLKMIFKVPGNFHLSTHSSRIQPTDPDMTHTVHELIFGDNVSEVLV